MAVYSIIQKSQLEGGQRLDSEFYHPEKLEAMEKLSKFGVSAIAENFRNVKETFNPLRHQLATTPARVFDLSDVSSFLLEEGKEVVGPDEVGSTKKIFRQNDVLISRLRPYLKEVSFVGFNDVQKLASTEFVVLRKKKDSKFPPQALFAFLITDEVQKILFWSQGGTEHPRFSENLLFISNNTGKISIKNKEEIFPEYLTIILQSIIGRWQFEKESSQAAQPKISDLQVRSFYIPILPKSTQQKIADLIQKSHQARSKAKQLLEQAKNKVANLIEIKS